jgi:diguanylate cyclase (GGDEF)-like protein/PAS domain S-box-containing protein
MAGADAWREHRLMRAAARRLLAACADVNVGIALFSAALIATLWTVVIMEQRSGREEVVAAAIKQNTNLAVAYEEHIVRTLKGLDGALLFIRHEYRRLGRKMDIARYIEEGIIDGRLFSIISLLDEFGNIVLSNKATAPTNYADREHFRIHQLGRRQDTFYIDGPVLGRVSNTWQIPMSRRIIKRDGSFGGTIVASVDPGYFTNFYQKTDIGKQGVVLLVGLDGITRARRVGNALSFGDNLSESTLLQKALQNAAGHFFSQGAVDGTSRLVSYRTLPGYPLMVAIGAAEEEVLADFVRNRSRDYVLALLLSLVIAGFAGILIVTLSRQKRASLALVSSEARFRATFDRAAIGIVHTSLDRRYLQVNQKYCDMLGYTRDELVGLPSNGFTHPDDREEGGQYREQLLSGETDSVSAERRYVCKNGSIIWTNRTVSLVRDHHGQPLYFLRIVEDVTERKRLEIELRDLATTDMLTGLPNRRAFIARLEDEHERLRRFESQQAAVLILDLDYFKSINDTHGHPGGDAMLRHVAEVIRDEIRAIDMSSRLGGEEFAVLLTGATLTAAREFAERLRRKIAALTVMHEGKTITVTASIGVAALRATDENADTALQFADKALYRAKDIGRDRVEVVVAGAMTAAAQTPSESATPA